MGLDIGTSGVRAAELSFGKGGVTLDRFGQVALPPGAVRDGEVVDPDAVATAIKQLWSSVKFSKRWTVPAGTKRKSPGATAWRSLPLTNSPRPATTM